MRRQRRRRGSESLRLTTNAYDRPGNDQIAAFGERVDGCGGNSWPRPVGFNNANQQDEAKQTLELLGISCFRHLI